MHAVKLSEIAHDPMSTSSYSPCMDPAVSQGNHSKKQSTYLPCHYFDFMAGTGTGG